MWYIHKKGLYTVLALALLGATSLMAQVADSEHVSKLLANAKTQAISAADDAELLQSYTRSQLSLTSHSAQIERIRGHVNELGRTVNDLKAARAEASPWQQLAIDRIDPLLQEMADTLTATIKHMNDNPGRIHMQPFRDYVAANYDLTNRAASVIRDFVEYGKVKARVQELEQKLEITAAEAGN